MSDQMLEKTTCNLYMLELRGFLHIAIVRVKQIAATACSNDGFRSGPYFFPLAGAAAFPPLFGAPAVAPDRTAGADAGAGASATSFPKFPTRAVTIALLDAKEEDFEDVRAVSLA